MNSKQEANIPCKPVSRLDDVKKQVGKIPLIRKPLFTYGCLVALVVLAFVLLPTQAPKNAFEQVSITVFVILCMGWVGLIFSDEQKPEWMKTTSVTVLFVLLGWLFYRYTTADWGKMAFFFLNTKIIGLAWSTLISGLWITIQIAFFAAILSTFLGLLLAVFRSFNNRILNIFIIGYIDFFRAMPIMVLMVLIYYALPFLGIRLEAMPAGIIALGLNSSAYVSEIFRAGFLSVGKGQIEASNALGMSPVQTMRLVLLPQAFRVVLPPLVSNYVASAKDTAICSSISIIELLKAGLSEQALLANPSPLIFSTVLYLIMFVPLTRFSGYLENRMKASKRVTNL